MDIPNTSSLPPPSLADILIECPDDIVNAGLEGDRVAQILRGFYNVHHKRFEHLSGFHILHRLNAQFESLLCLNYDVLQLRMLFQTPQDKKGYAWRKLIKHHIAVLNSPSRVNRSQHYWDEAYKCYVRLIETHYNRIHTFWEEYCGVLSEHQNSEFLDNKPELTHSLDALRSKVESAATNSEFNPNTIALTEECIMQMHGLITYTLRPASV